MSILFNAKYSVFIKNRVLYYNYRYEFKNWNLEFLNQPMTPYILFFLKVWLPKPDHGKRGFSDAYINKVRKLLYGKEADLMSGRISRFLS